MESNDRNIIESIISQKLSCYESLPEDIRDYVCSIGLMTFECLKDDKVTLGRWFGEWLEKTDALFNDRKWDRISMGEPVRNTVEYPQGAEEADIEELFEIQALQLDMKPAELRELVLQCDIDDYSGDERALVRKLRSALNNNPTKDRRS